MSTAINVEAVTKAYGELRAVDDIDLEVAVINRDIDLLAGEVGQRVAGLQPHGEAGLLQLEQADPLRQPVRPDTGIGRDRQRRGVILGKGGAQQMAEQFELPYLGELPLIQSIREGGDSGMPAVLDGGSPAREAFLALGAALVRNISIRNAKSPTNVPV